MKSNLVPAVVLALVWLCVPAYAQERSFAAFEAELWPDAEAKGAPEAEAAAAEPQEAPAEAPATEGDQG